MSRKQVAFFLLGAFALAPASVTTARGQTTPGSGLVEPRIDTGIESSEAAPPPAPNELRQLQPGDPPTTENRTPRSRSESSGSSNTAPAPEPAEETEMGRVTPGRAYVGVLVEPLDPSLRAHLPQLLGEDRGILVRHVEPQTPAARAGLQENDILLDFGDKELGAPRDLVAAVGAASPGDKIPLRILRAGKAQSLDITLGEIDPISGMRRRSPSTDFLPEDAEDGENSTAPDMPGLPLPPRRPDVPRSTPAPGNHGFEALSMRHLEGGVMRIEYTFQGEKGDTERYTFRGSPDEIRKQIDDNQWLNDERKRSLLQALETAGRATGMFGGSRQFMPPRGLMPQLEQLLQQDEGASTQTY